MSAAPALPAERGGAADPAPGESTAAGQGRAPEPLQGGREAGARQRRGGGGLQNERQERQPFLQRFID